MNLQHIGAIAARKFSTIRRDHRMFGFIILMPALQILLFGYAIGPTPADLDVAVMGDHPIVEQLNESDVLIQHQVLSVEEGRQMVEDGDAWAFIDASNTSVVLHFDASNQQIMQTIIKEVRTALEASAEKQGISALPVEQAQPVYGESDAEFIDFLAPGIMVLVCFMFSVILTSMAFVGERNDGTLERIFAAGVQPFDVLLGHLLAFSSILIGQVSVVILIAIGVFDIPMEGSLPLLFAMALLLGWASMCLGLFISSKAKSEFQAMQLVMPIVFPALLLSGILWPIEALPGVLLVVSLVLPTTWAAEAFRSIMVRGWGIESAAVWQAFLVITAFGLLSLLLARVSLKARS